MHITSLFTPECTRNEVYSYAYMKTVNIEINTAS